jgi:site-specific DNA-methyltransferase (adenine-specific)
MVDAALYSSRSEDWATPPALFGELHREFGFDTDVCAAEWNHKVSRYWTKAEDALTQDWTGRRCWMNPPYGRAIAHWIKKAYVSSRAPSTRP